MTPGPCYNLSNEEVAALIAIVGAGAAGLMAAIAAISRGLKVEIYEKMDRPGIKLGLAGGGRCNLSNTGDLLAGLHGASFLRPALANLDACRLRQVLADLGVATKVDEQGRVYPRELTGRELAEHLHSWLRQKGVRFHFNAPLTGIATKAGKLTALQIGDREVKCSRAIVACGGNTYAKAGSDGRAAAILQGAGHTVLPFLPALTPVKTREAWPTELKGISLQATVTVQANGKALDQAQGNILFTHFGLSGPAILDISHAAARTLHRGQRVEISLDLLPDLTPEAILSRLEEQRQKTLANALATLLPQQLAQTVGSAQYIKGLAPTTLARIARGLKETRLEIVDTLGKNHAMVSQGGVGLREVNPRTMESRLIEGLFIAGEILDYHGRTGGYNLHAAFATGWLAGEHA